ncbi:hypothetical protein OJAV_G00210050 [Oryzias javanicus]|uniref:Guanylate kinase-like domain-containing protein n=1 Tax=Oryzias javanicus TaxID=123683 RepID=A0A437C7I1_ORYJA|nr:hypothetical protein OJAV_G00210050 [Oryzias javanicus]
MRTGVPFPSSSAVWTTGMRQTMEDGVSEVLSSVVEDIGEAVTRNISGAQILHELLSAPWLHALLKMYECLIQFQKMKPNPFLPYASGLSYEIMTLIQRAPHPSPEARELFGLLSSPHVQALLSSHDSVAQEDYLPVLPPLPDELPEDEEAMRIVCLVKNNQPLTTSEHRSLGLHSSWNSLHGFPLEPPTSAKGAWSGEELRRTESEAKHTSHPKRSHPQGFVTHYEMSGNCVFCPQNAVLWKQRLNLSDPAVFSPNTQPERSKPKREGDPSSVSEDYAYLPPPVPVYSQSLPNSPLLYKKRGKSRTASTLNKASAKVHTAPVSPAAQCPDEQQNISTFPLSDSHRRYKAGSRKKTHEEFLNPSTFHQYQHPSHNGCKSQPIPPQKEKPEPQCHQAGVQLSKQCSVEELRSTVQTVVSTIEHSSQDVRQLGQKMVAATEMIADSVEENAQAVNLLAEVVEKLQGIIVAKKQHGVSPSTRPKHNPPTPPPRVSSLSPKVVRKPPTPYPSQLSSCSSSSSASSGAEDFGVSQNKNHQVTLRAGGCGSNGHVWFDSETVSRAHMEGRQESRIPFLHLYFFKSSFRADTHSDTFQGATIRRDEETGEIYIARVIHGGLADRSGLLHPGDLIVEVNGNPVVGLEPAKVIRILTNSTGTILFKVIPNSTQVSSNQKPVYMRAMVDYCPRKDSSIPCPDAGMPFSRGSLLEVVDQSDAQWWQARKLPCGASFARLIPSASTLKSKQREHWWCQPLHVHTCMRPVTLAASESEQTSGDDKSMTAEMNNAQDINIDEADSDFTEGIYLAGFRRSFHVWKRTSFKKRRQSCSSCSPNSSAMATPYEEVVLYQRPPQENHRLIMLVGASGVGVNELRKRLIKLNPSTFQGPVPHTTRPMREGEQMGREYHFVTKELFEYMVCNHRFVEYGESRGHLYGTSFDSIDEVLKHGRMCIVDAESHSIPLLRTRKLKPFVIFIKPPSPERLRQTRKNATIVTNDVTNRPFTEEDFVEMEEVSRLIETKYKQFFDRVLVNDSLQDASMKLCSIVHQAQNEPQWIPVNWILPEEQ